MWTLCTSTSWQQHHQQRSDWVTDLRECRDVCVVPSWIIHPTDTGTRAGQVSTTLTHRPCCRLHRGRVDCSVTYTAHSTMYQYIPVVQPQCQTTQTTNNCCWVLHVNCVRARCTNAQLTIWLTVHLQLTSLNRPIKLVKQRVIGCLFVNTGRRWPWPWMRIYCKWNLR